MSAPSNDCYDQIIGLYNGDCDCLDGRPLDYNESDSGLYISDLLEPKFIDGLLNCDQGDSVWEMMEDVRDLSIRYFIADSNALLLKSNKLKRNPFKGGIGLSTYTKDRTLTALDYAGVRLYSPLIRSGFIKIKKIGLLLNTTTAINLFIYNRNGELLHTIPLNATANVHTINDITDITLPLYDEHLDYIEYHIFYQVNGFQPKNNQLHACSTCQKHKPGWGHWYYDHKHPWIHWVNVAGFNSTGLPDFDTTLTGYDYLNGLTFQVEIGCMVGEVFCKDALDFDSNTLAAAMAVAIQHKAGIEFISKVLRSQNLNRHILAWREQLTKDRDEWVKTYQDMITYISDNIDIEANDCFECKDVIEMIHGGIFA